ncbi:MAG: hypothetical protein IIC89_01990 [Chloroflexi bacterium]|nr:hypothetical protein [Chloroflexota bacterium]
MSERDRHVLLAAKRLDDVHLSFERGRHPRPVAGRQHQVFGPDAQDEGLRARSPQRLADRRQQADEDGLFFLTIE